MKTLETHMSKRTANQKRMQAYSPPQRGAHIDLCLDSNEGPPPPMDMLLVDNEICSVSIQRYPDATALQKQLADEHGVAAEQVLVTAGGDDALDRVMRSCLTPGSACILTTPTFEMLERYARLGGAMPIQLPWWTGDFPVGEILNRITPKTRVIAVVSPNNPTGAIATIQDIRALASSAPQAVLLVDLAYVEFADVDPTDEILSLPNVVIVRTMSKAWGMAGLRVGYAVGPRRIIDAMRAVGSPYPVSSSSLALAQKWRRSGREQVNAYIDQVRSERSDLTALLIRLGAKPLPSQGNFVLAGFKNPQWVYSALGSLGTAVRRFQTNKQLDQFLRISCPGGPHNMRRLTDALTCAVEPQALLFDLDGVLADVTQSYRNAIKQTAADFGVSVNSKDIAEAKFQGDCNNDWQLTHRLICERGVVAEYSAVRQRFEEFYQGCTASPGLRCNEKLLIDPGQLRNWAQRYPLAIVTGRPRSDALKFLDQFGIRNIFKTIVAMEDAPSKPDPAPVQLALQRLNVKAAWMMGDTVDDIRAARSAGVVPLGVTTTEQDPQAAAVVLRNVGAASVLSNLSELEALLP